MHYIPVFPKLAIVGKLRETERLEMNASKDESNIQGDQGVCRVEFV
jgi:hypothetical protein